jgi:hypothetical protein
MSFSKLNDQIFKLREREKNTFTSRLKSLTEEERAVDTILKINKLEVWGKGLSKGLKSYDKETYDEESKVMNKIAEIENGLRRKGIIDEGNLDLQLEERFDEIETQNLVDTEEYGMARLNEDYYNNYDGDEAENLEDYN